MAILKCKKCDFSKKVPERYVDAKVRCPECNEVVTVQAEAEDLALEDVIGMVPEDSAPEPARRHEAIPEEELTRKDAPLGDQPGIFEGGAAKNIMAGLASGIVTVMISIAIAGLVFSQGPLADNFHHAISMALISAIIMSMVVAARSGIACSAAGPESMAGLFLFLLTSSIYHQMGAGPAEALYPTVLASVFVAAVFTGLCLLAAGMTRSGDFIRYVPIQAVGGVLAGIGLIIIIQAFNLALGTNACLEELFMKYAQMEFCIKWAPAAALGIVLFICIRWIHNAYVIASVLLLSMGGLFGFLHYEGIGLAQARELGWLFAAHEPDLFWLQVYDVGFLKQIDWNVILDHAGHYAALAGLVLASTMIRVSEMEVLDSRPIDLNREFTALGFGSIFTGFAGGMPGALSLDRSLARRSAGAHGKIAGFIVALVCMSALAFSHKLLPYLPRFIPAGILFALGLGLMWRWIIETRTRFTQKGDYALLILIFLLTSTMGLLPGLAMGAGLAMLVTAGRYGSVSVVKHDISGAHFHSNVDRAPTQIAMLKTKGDHIYAMTLQGFIFMGTTNNLLEMILDRARDEERLPLKFVLLDFTFISGLDSSVAISFIKLKQMAQRHEFILIFTNVPFELEAQLGRAGCELDDPYGGSVTVVSMDYALEWAEDRILEEEDMLTIKQQALPSLLAPIFPEQKYIPALMKILKRIEVKKNKPVFSQGDPSDAMYFIESGMVNVQLELEGGKKLRLKKMGPGTVFGEMGLYTSAPRTASIIAAENCVLYKLSTKVMNLLQAKRPEIASSVHRFVVSLLADRVSGANATIRDILR
ncbi:SulP family inorganic anion transporter [Desulfovibrio ferrophilus]|uniref:Cyclic nucleotide-binding protein n=1 Tax=Desulfovibrio ferrophilus TaxID=241368 RepID=A0A2Z6B0W9_9BACT|nr:SulP family inorganic anion transporter [Desulfovibrio ferrophilus]BBD09105.1 cyclic nucleotide-binding protein [Desulfovibrio ferrophilus]